MVKGIASVVYGHVPIPHDLQLIKEWADENRIDFFLEDDSNLPDTEAYNVRLDNRGTSWILLELIFDRKENIKRYFIHLSNDTYAAPLILHSEAGALKTIKDLVSSGWKKTEAIVQETANTYGNLRAMQDLHLRLVSLEQQMQ